MGIEKYIRTCYGEYIESTNIETISSDNEDELKDALYKIKSFVENSFIYFSKSILCGEYIYSDTFDKDINTFLHAMSVEYSPTDTKDKKTILNNRIQDINKSLFNSIRHLQSVQMYAKQKFDPKDNSNDFASFKTYISTNPSRLDDFINLCIPVCKFDYKFPSK